MISRRQIFTFFGLLLVPFRWRMFAQQKPAPARMMSKIEGENLRIYGAEDRFRIEYFDQHMVIISRHDLQKTFTLNLATKTYSIKAFPTEPTATEPTVTARLLTDVVKSGEPIPLYPDPFVPYDPSLFEIPRGFHRK